MKDKTTIVLVVVLVTLIGVYVWHSQRIHRKKAPASAAAITTPLSPTKAMARKVRTAIKKYKKEKGSVPASLEQLKGSYLDNATYKLVKSGKIEYTFVNPQAYRISFPTSASTPVAVAAKKATDDTRAPELAKTAPPSVPEIAAPEAVGWRYDPRNKPDPFKSFIIASAQEAAPVKRRQPLTPLQKMPLSEVQSGLKAIIWGEMGSKALVEDATGKGYVVQEGTYVGQNDGIVKRIFADKIVVEEYRRDPVQGALKTNEVVLKLKKLQREE
jgi:Tfp pilus assembly protein PilP